jgi:RimJ/RimL family protein N-acetyltransferase
MDVLPHEQILGERVLLRTPERRDAEPIAAGCNDPAVVRFLPLLPSPYRIPDALAWIDGARAHREQGGASFVIVDPGSDEVLGSIGLNDVNPVARTGEVGYWVAPWARRRGVASDATHALTAWAHAHGLARLTLLTEAENWPSQRVALACGYQREGVARGRGVDRDGVRHDLIVWARLAADPAPTRRLLPDLPGPPDSTGQPTSPGAHGQLSDGVVVLRPLFEPDAPAMYQLGSLPEVVNTSVPPRAPTPAEALARCARSYGRWLAGERCELAILDAASGAFAGEIGLFYQEPATGQAMIGYGLLPAFRGRGFTTRAVQALTAWAYTEIGLARIIAGTAPHNYASHAVLRRAGFTQEAYLRARLPAPHNTRTDDLQWALLNPNLRSHEEHPANTTTPTHSTN